MLLISLVLAAAVFIQNLFVHACQLFVYCLFTVPTAFVSRVHFLPPFIECYLVILAQLIFDIVTFLFATDHGVFGLDLPV